MAYNNNMTEFSAKSRAKLSCAAKRYTRQLKYAFPAFYNANYKALPTDPDPPTKIYSTRFSLLPTPHCSNPRERSSVEEQEQ